MKDKYTFDECTVAIMDDVFGLRRKLKSQALDNWLGMTPEITTDEKAALDRIQHLLLLGGDAWNEQELSLNFIGPLFGLVNFIELYKFNLFAQRHIGTTVPSVEGDKELGGEPDGMIATGYRTPKIPMFAFSEYKRAIESGGDPPGQTLAAALVGQILNQNSTPIYGCYVIGETWHFLVLEGKNYTISAGLSAVTDEILDIYRILKALKSIIIELTAK